MPIIKSIKAQETYTIRQAVLRQGLPIESCVFPNDDSNSTVHLGYFENENLVGVISLFLNSNEIFEVQNQYQIRGMAVLENYQKKGIGNALVKEAEKLLYDKNINFIWFNARENAVGFYEKLGYKTFGTRFDISGVGFHFVMYKHLNL